MQNGKTVNIVDGSRTPFLKAEGKRGPFTASDLAVSAARPLLARQHFDPTDLDEVILGCAAPSADEANIGRVVSLRLGCGDAVPAWTVMRNCASGMQALDSAATNISHGRADLILAGGTESMSHAPVLYNDKMVNWLADLAKAKTPVAKASVLAKIRPGHLKPIIGLLRGLTDPVVGLSMGQTAENLAYRFKISRDDMDHFALRSHQRLAAATDEGRLGEMENLYDTKGKTYDADNGLRRDSSMEKLAKLRAVFDREVGNVTAGNSAQITDGASWLILASDDAVKQHDLPVMGRIVDSQWAGLDPRQMGLGPVHASTPILQRHALGLSDIDYWEVNEAFAAQVLGCVAAWQDNEYCTEELGLDGPLGELDEDTLNVDGGAVSIGHPVGASGARIVLHLLHVLREKDKNRGMATICIGGGQGGAMLLERAA
ncbi:MAG: acetyl-CoA C-acetyltransferase [Gammaproteobacteria bacterium]|nr:acetyl-CoA C-acetyltransferase [Gammaproteobacteria bacterium]